MMPTFEDPFNYDRENEYNPDAIIDDETRKKILEDLKEIHEFESMDPEEREKRIKEKLKEQFDREHGISPRVRAEFDRVEEEIHPLRIQMVKFWERLIGEGLREKRIKVPERKKGDLHVPSFIKHYPRIVEGIRTGEIKKQPIHEHIESRLEKDTLPERLEISLVADLSGSMGETKREILRKTMALLLLSLQDFNRMLMREGSDLRAYSEVIVFGSSAARRKEFAKDKRAALSGDERAELMKVLSVTEEDWGGTNDADALAIVSSDVDASKEKEILSGKTKKIVFEITDGEPNSQEDTRREVDALINKNVIPIGFQIGVDKGNSAWQTFDYVWNEGRKEKLGIHIEGEKLDELPKQLMKILKKKIGKIRL